MIRGIENPHDHLKVERGRGKYFWRAMSIKGVIGPYYIDEPTVNGAGILYLLRNYSLPKLRTLPSGTFLQQDGAMHINGR